MSRLQFGIIFFIISIINVNVSAQGFHCGNDSRQYQHLSREAERNIDYYINRNIGQRPTGTVITIPVVLHIVYKNEIENISMEQIKAQLKQLNDAFNNRNNSENIPTEFRPLIGNMEIQFCLSAIDPMGDSTNSIIRIKTTNKNVGMDTSIFYTALGGSDAWDTKKYLNIWVTDIGDWVLGYGIYPWEKTPYRDGVVINYRCFGNNPNSLKYNLGRTLVHEVGHYLGLYHLWDNGGCDSVNDYVMDTPSQEYNYEDLPTYPQYSCGVSNMFMNYMDYVDDKMLLLFTKGQKQRVLACLNLYRPELLTNDVICYEIPLPDNIILYPNPIHNTIRVDWVGLKTNRPVIAVYDITGRKMKIQIKSDVNNQMEIDLSDLASGVYFIKVNSIGKKVLKI